MSDFETPVLDPRATEDLLAELLARTPAYVPELKPRDGGPSKALYEIFGRYTQAVIDRLNRAPDKNKLAFLDMLGISLIPAGAARAAVVFTVNPQTAGGRLVAPARLGAQEPGRSKPIVFETETTIALSPAGLRQVATIFPARDEYADYTLPLAGHKQAGLFRRALPVPHEIYLAHSTLLAFDGTATVDVEFELTAGASRPLSAVWEHFDGQTWRQFAGFDAANRTASQDGTGGFKRSGIVSLRAVCGDSKKATVDGIENYWIRARLTDPLPPDPAFTLPQVDRIRIRSVLDRTGAELAPDTAFAGAARADTSKTVFPFGKQPQPGDTFYFASEEVFGKPGAQVVIDLTIVPPLPPPPAPPSNTPLTPEVAWEYWNGRQWKTLIAASTPPALFTGSGQVQFPVPPDLSPAEVNGKRALWVRVRMTGGGYGFALNLSVNGQNIRVIETTPPALATFGLNYVFRSPLKAPDECLTFSDFQYEFHSRDVRAPGKLFALFRPVADAVPALYLGFDRPLPNDLVSLFIDVEESAAALPELVWEAWNGEEFRALRVNDETENLRHRGIVSFVPPVVLPRPKATVTQAAGRRVVTGSPQDAAVFSAGNLVVIAQDKQTEVAFIGGIDGAALLLQAPLANTYSSGSVTLAALPRFGAPLDWVRARLKQDGAPAPVLLNGVYLNAVNAVQIQTVDNELLGSASGQPNQTVFFTQIPVLPGEQVEVRELDGPRAAVELPILQEELFASGFKPDDLRIVTDARTQRVSEVWVRWRSKPHLFFSGPADRDYILERAGGRLIFGDGLHGKQPPAGANNIRARVYRSGGGLAGNVSAGAINLLLSSAPAVQSVTNPREAEAGAGGESGEQVSSRGPQNIRHRDRALSAGDYEALAREASPGVAIVRALPATSSNLLPAPGWVTLIIVPQSREARPQPSFELRSEVHGYLAARSPATVPPSRIAVVGPVYLLVGVSATIVPSVPDQAGDVKTAVEAAVAEFLQPVSGGPEGRGWPFGRDVFLSDVAALVEGVPGVDHAQQLELLLGDAPVGERVAVPSDRIVAAGAIRIEVQVE